MKINMVRCGGGQGILIADDPKFAKQSFVDYGVVPGICNDAARTIFGDEICFAISGILTVRTKNPRKKGFRRVMARCRGNSNERVWYIDCWVVMSGTARAIDKIFPHAERGYEAPLWLKFDTKSRLT